MVKRKRKNATLRSEETSSYDYDRFYHRTASAFKNLFSFFSILPRKNLRMISRKREEARSWKSIFGKHRDILRGAMFTPKLATTITGVRDDVASSPTLNAT